jgi:hypothetical protein
MKNLINPRVKKSEEMNLVPVVQARNTKNAAGRSLNKPLKNLSLVFSYFNSALFSGKHWLIAALESISLWDTSYEEINGERYLYIIENEALDWLAIVNRLCSQANGLCPENEINALLLNEIMPRKLTKNEFSSLIGKNNYKRHLNYFYGVTIEEALEMVVLQEIRKESGGFKNDNDTAFVEEAYRRIYGEKQSDLIGDFFSTKGLLNNHQLSLSEYKEFRYWLFKYRIKHNDRARVASDTKKALNYMRRQVSSRT